MLKNKKNKKFSCGFTLIEMMVSVAIIAVISAVIVYNHGKFNSNLAINNAAYKTALAVRQAQVYGISAKQVDSSQSQDISFRLPYGVHFNNPFTSSNDDKFIFFADADNNGRYQTDGAGSNDDLICGLEPNPQNPQDKNECLEQIILNQGIEIAGFYVSDAGDWHDVSDDFSNLHSIDIVFTRPNPDAKFSFYRNVYHSSGNGTVTNKCGGQDDCEGVAICLASLQGQKKRVVVLTTGQVSVEDVEDNGVCSNPTDSGGNNGNGNNNNNNNNQGNQGFGDDN